MVFGTGTGGLAGEWTWTVSGEELDLRREEGEERVETVPGEEGERDGGIPGEGSREALRVLGVSIGVAAAEAEVVPSSTSGSFPLSPLPLSSLPLFFSDHLLFLL
jgi:hypothetical protein